MRFALVLSFALNMVFGLAPAHGQDNEPNSDSSAASSARPQVAKVVLVSARGKSLQNFLDSQIGKSNEECVVNGLKGAGAIAGATFLGIKLNSSQNQGNNMVDNVLNSKSNVQGSIAANHLVIDKCKSANFICTTATREVKTRLVEGYNQLNGGQNAEQVALIKSDIQAVTQVAENCTNTYLRYAAEATRNLNLDATAELEVNDVFQKIAKTGKEGGALEWLGDNYGKVGAGALAAGGAAYLLKKKKEDGGSAESNEAAKEAEVAKAATADVTCKTERAYEFQHCQKYLKSLCALTTNVEDSRCRTFSDNYCGVTKKTGLSKVATEAQAAGVGSQLCQDTLAARYCLKADKQNKCYSCIDLKSRASASCASNPGACSRLLSDAEMLNYKKACGDDPVFSLPKWAHIQVPAEDPTATVTKPTIFTSSATAAQATAVRVASDVSAASSLRVESQSSQTLKLVCTSGSLNCQ